MMRKFLYITLAAAFAACSGTDAPIPDPEPPVTPPETVGGDRLVICNEGNWQSDNGQLSYYDTATGELENQWFRKVNDAKLGDTPTDIIQVNDSLIAIAVNWSNIIQYIRPDGTACGATENVPNCRRLCADADHIYVSSYAHRSGDTTYDKGYVAKVDICTRRVVATCETGWEPDGMALYGGRLYVANSGGYAFAEDHDYETTVNVIDTRTMTVTKTIDTGCINLYGDIAQAGRYLCINSGGDYYTEASGTVVLDCETDRCTVYPFPSTCSATDGTLFYTVGVEFSYLTGESKVHIHTIDPASGEVTDGILGTDFTALIQKLGAPYCLYVSPYTGNFYLTDARNYGTAGYLYGYSAAGTQLFEPQKLYVNPGSILALKPQKDK